MKYIVPYDFTPVAHTALEHALAIARIRPGQIEILHIIPSEKEREAAENKFRELRSQLNGQGGQDIEYKVRTGDIFKDISREAEEGRAELLVMGTHGEKGLQRIFGSYAIKVITSSKTPFIITQEKGPVESIKLIVLPVDLSKERVQVVKFAARLARIFKAEIHLVCKPETDEWLKKRLNNNIQRALQFLQKEEVPHRLARVEGMHHFYEEVIDYAAEQHADLLAIAYFPETVFPQFERFSQEIITNELQLPVLVVNAQEVGSVGEYGFIGI